MVFMRRSPCVSEGNGARGGVKMKSRWRGLNNKTREEQLGAVIRGRKQTNQSCDSKQVR